MRNSTMWITHKPNAPLPWRVELREGLTPPTPIRRKLASFADYDELVSYVRAKRDTYPLPPQITEEAKQWLRR